MLHSWEVFIDLPPLRLKGGYEMGAAGCWAGWWEEGREWYFNWPNGLRNLHCCNVLVYCGCVSDVF